MEVRRLDNNNIKSIKETFGHSSIRIQCPKCNNLIPTITENRPGKKMRIIGLLLCGLG